MTSRSTPPRRLAAAAALLAAAAALADPPNSPLQAAIDAVGSPVFAERERATAVLRDAPVPDEELAAALADQRLNAEQRLRLRQILRARFDARDRGAVGVRFVNARPTFDNALPQIGELVDGFPAGDAGLIRPGDVIAVVDGIPLLSLRPAERLPEIRAAVMSRTRGDRLAITILRPDDPAHIFVDPDNFGHQRLELDIPLGAWAGLNAAQANSVQFRDDYETAWQRFLRRVGAPAAPGPAVLTLPQLPGPDDNAPRNTRGLIGELQGENPGHVRPAAFNALRQLDVRREQQLKRILLGATPGRRGDARPPTHTPADTRARVLTDQITKHTIELQKLVAAREGRADPATHAAIDERIDELVRQRDRQRTRLHELLNPEATAAAQPNTYISPQNRRLQAVRQRPVIRLHDLRDDRNERNPHGEQPR